jgi:ankyrin repeat protein
MYAALNDAGGAAALLLNAGADRTLVNSEHDTAADLARRAGNQDLANLLEETRAGKRLFGIL